jgi:hypothetical protein
VFLPSERAGATGLANSISSTYQEVSRRVGPIRDLASCVAEQVSQIPTPMNTSRTIHLIDDKINVRYYHHTGECWGISGLI